MGNISEGLSDQQAKLEYETWERARIGRSVGRAGGGSFQDTLRVGTPKINSKFNTLKDVGSKAFKTVNFLATALELLTGPPLGDPTPAGYAYTTGQPDLTKQPRSIQNTIVNRYYVSGPGTDYSTQTVAYVPIYPPRKLRPKLDAIDTQDSADTRQPIITAEQSFSARKWGSILHQPVSEGKLKIYEWESEQFIRELNEKRQYSEERLNDWLLNNNPIELHEQSLVLIDNYDFDSQTKRLSQFSGMNSIQSLYDFYYVKSQLRTNLIIDTIPKEIEIKKQRLQQASYKQDPMLYSNSRGGHANRVSDSDVYPLVLPSILTGKDEGNTVVKSHSEFMLFIFKMLDNLTGQFPIEIEIEDANLAQSGNQTVKVELKNMSEAIAEVYSMGINNQLYQQLFLALHNKTMVQGTQTLISSNITQEYVKANAEFLGFERQETDREIEIPFTPNTGKFSEMVKHSKQKYATIENTDDKDLNTYLADFMQAASIIKGSLFRKTPIDKDGLLKRLTELLKVDSKNDESSDQNWDEFLQDVEKGFINKTVTDKVNP
jgi:hypothetical protein